MMKRTAWAGVLAVSILFVWACGDAAERIGEMLSDAATLPDAHAQDPARTVTLACDQAFTRVTTYSGTKHIYTQWWATQSGLGSFAKVHAERCGRQVIGTDPYYSECADPSTCEGEQRPVPLNCDNAHVEWESGSVQVYCGFESHTVDAEGVEGPLSGMKWTEITLFLD